MKKVSFVLAALATIAVALPSIASAQEIGVRVGGDRDFHRNRGNSVSTARTVVLVLNTACVKIVVGIAVGTATATRIGW